MHSHKCVCGEQMLIGGSRIVILFEFYFNSDTRWKESEIISTNSNNIAALTWQKAIKIKFEWRNFSR